MFTNAINPVIVQLGPVQIKWYGLVYVIGFALAYYLLWRAAKEKRVKNLTTKNLDELLLYLIIGVVVGSRLLLFLVGHPMQFLEDPLEVFRIWHGGMSFHGGLVGIVFFGWLFCRKYKVRFYALADLLAAPAAFMLFVGRIANFINGELVGTVTNVPWCVQYGHVQGCRHPSQLYEAGKNLVIFFSLLGFQRLKGLKEGTIFWSFVLMYGTLRFFVTFFRDDPRLILGLSGGQVLSLAMALIAGYVLFTNYRRK